jgi:hypothetical protein
VPSAPRAIAARREGEKPTARREYESYDWYEGVNVAVPAGTTPVPLFTFSGMPDRIMVYMSGGTHFVRLRNPGEAAGAEIVLTGLTQLEFRVGARIVEIRDATGAGGSNANIVGYYGTRSIDRRASRRGPLASDVRARDQGAPEQLEPR